MPYRLLLATLSMMASPLVAAEPAERSPVRLRENGPAITPEQAKALSAAALGDVLLAAGHPPVTEVTVGPEGMEPPAPPEGPISTRINLYLEPVRSGKAGFCERVVASVYLAPVNRLQDGDLPASSAAQLWTEIAFRWVGLPQDGVGCTAPRRQFFTVRPGAEDASLEAVRLLGLASQDARLGRRLSFPVSIDDREGQRRLADARQYPDVSRTSRFEIITDARKALASLPVDAVSSVGFAATAYRTAFQPADRTNTMKPGQRAMTVFLGGDCDVRVIIRDGRIKSIRMVREIPPPF